MDAKFLLAHTLKARVSFKFRRSYVSKYKFTCPANSKIFEA